MSDANWNVLREYLLNSYAELVRQLARKLHSRERAEDALQDTFEKLQRGSGEIAVLQSPRGYLLQMATRIALDRARSEHRYISVTSTPAGSQSGDDVPGSRVLTVDDGDAFIHRVDEAPGPERIILGRSELRRFIAIVNQMPQRRREMFVAAWVEELSYQEIAEKFGLSLRSVQRELMYARQYCLSRFERGE